ncbi:MAG: hypothetical protein D6820_07775, partial [Lentisphaerae bacterium]
ASDTTRMKNYPKTITINAQALASEDPIQKSALKLGEFKREFIGLEKGGTVTMGEIEEAFRGFLKSKGKDEIFDSARSLIQSERQFFNQRTQWFKGFSRALEMALKYNNLVSNTGSKFGPGWDKRKGIRNRSNIAYFLEKSGWFPRKVKPRPGDQVWIMSINDRSIIAQIRRYTTSGKVLPVGVEEIPLWEAVNTDVFYYLASQPKVKITLGSEFEEARACHDFFIRPPVFKTHIENGVSGSSVEFLKGELDRALRVWEPKWAKECIERLEKALKAATPTARKLYYAKYKEILGPLKLFRDKQSELESLVKPSR